MQKRMIQVGLAGMNQDVINPQVNSKYAFEIKNFRINATSNSNAIELTSEKSTRQVTLKDTDGTTNFTINQQTHKVIGHCAINDSLVLFVAGKSTNPDMILHFKFIDTGGGVDDKFRLQSNGSFKGDLNFGTLSENQVECIPYFENSDVIKIYWIDGRNYPRVINICRDYEWDTLQTIDPFSFYQKIGTGSYNKIDVTKSYVGGLFYAGVIQYAFSFYNKNSQETPIIYTTPLNYISHSDRGEEPNKQLGCAFNITIAVDQEDRNNFDYVRVYSIYRSSINSSHVVKVIKDIKCSSIQLDPNFGYIATFTDTNEQGYDFDAYRILVNSDHIKPETIATKDVKLFLGNYESDSIVTGVTDITGVTIQWEVSSGKTVPSVDYKTNQLYPWKNQLSNNSDKIKTFKFGEWYKFGVQFQDIYGNWSQPYYLNTPYNDKHPITGDDYYQLPYAYTTGTPASIYASLSQKEKDFYVRMRPVVSYPTESERNVVCQGIVNPTVFNLGQRVDGSCYAQSSWFFRPYPSNWDDANGQTFYNREYYYQNAGYVQFKHWEPLYRSNSIGGELQNMYFDYYDDGSGNTCQVTSMSYDPTGDVRTMSVQDIDDDYKRYYLRACDILRKDNGAYDSFYYVDQNVVTLNSPELEFNKNTYNVDLQQYKTRLIGHVDFHSSAGRYNIIADTPLFLNSDTGNSGTLTSATEYLRSNDRSFGFYNKICNQLLDGDPDQHGFHKGGAIVSALNCWFDDVCDIITWDGHVLAPWNRENRQLSYYVYPWQKDHLNNYSKQEYVYAVQNNAGTSTEPDASSIIKKVLSNIRFGQTVYFNTTHNISTDIIKLFNSQENQLLKLENDKFYYGNVDKLVTCTSEYNGLQLYKYNISGETADIQTLGWRIHEKIGYPIVIDYKKYKKDNPVQGYGEMQNFDEIVKGDDPVLMNYSASETSGVDINITTGTTNFEYFGNYTPKDSASDPIQIRYKSSPHVVMKLTNNDILPIAGASASGLAFTSITTGSPRQVIWDYDNPITSLEQSTINTPTYSGLVSYLWLGELYKYEQNQSVLNPYCKTDSFDMQDRIWVPCGKTYDVTDSTNQVKWTEGDTYFQRYDCLKTYPFSNEDKQSVVEIASFMVETHVNLDGRYDENRGLYDNTYVNPTNFNLINPVYSQMNNFFQYNILDEENFRTKKFPTRFTWSLNKVNGQEIDEWTRTNTAAFYDCDGGNGAITSMRRFNNQIYAFQERGISRIKYNENVAINTQNGVPIELGNSQTVNGVDYVSDMVGSQNKWSCVTTPNGVFFVDKNTKGIYRLGGGESALTSLTKMQMQRWFGNVMDNSDVSLASYDATMNEVLFEHNTTKNIAFNIDYNAFTSFYDYYGMIGNLGRHTYNIHEDTVNHEIELHFLREGAGYNRFYGETQPYWITFVANSNIEGYSPANAIYDNVWYNADVLGSNSNTMNYNEQIDLREATGSNWGETFNKIEVGNDYQYGIFDATASGSTQTKNFQFIKKFRTWRVPVPRNQRGTGTSLHRDRIRGQWMRVKLTNTSPSTDKMVLRDIYVDSFY